MARLDRLVGRFEGGRADRLLFIGREFDRNLLAQVAPDFEAPVLSAALRRLLAAELAVISGTSQSLHTFPPRLDLGRSLPIASEPQTLPVSPRDRRRDGRDPIPISSLPSQNSSRATIPRVGATTWRFPIGRKQEKGRWNVLVNHEASRSFSNALSLAERLPDGQQRNIETLTARLRLAEALTEVGRYRVAATHYLVRCRGSAPSERHRIASCVIAARLRHRRNSLATRRSTGHSGPPHGGRGEDPPWTTASNVALILSASRTRAPASRRCEEEQEFDRRGIATGATIG